MRLKYHSATCATVYFFATYIACSAGIVTSMRSRSIEDCTAGSLVGRAFPTEPISIAAAAALRNKCLPARTLRMRANISAIMAKPTTQRFAGPSRREFIATGAIAAAAWTIVPRHVLGRGLTPPSDLLNIAIVGISGMGGANAEAVMSENIVAICDVDDALVDARLESWKMSLQ